MGALYSGAAQGWRKRVGLLQPGLHGDLELSLSMPASSFLFIRSGLQHDLGLWPILLPPLLSCTVSANFLPDFSVSAFWGSQSMQQLSGQCRNINVTHLIQSTKEPEHTRSAWTFLRQALLEMSYGLPK